MSLRKKSKLFRPLAIALAILVVSASTLMTVSASINSTYSLDFETGTSVPPNSTYHGWDSECVRTDSLTMVSSPVRFGSKAFKVNLLKTDPLVPGTGAGGKRAELSCNLQENSPQEHWYGISIYLPTTHATDTSAEIITQWHTVIHQGSPPIGLETQNGSWKVNINNDYNQATWGDTYNLGSYSGDLGKWTDWVFHVKWGWNSSQNPILHIYKRTPSVSMNWGTPILTYTQPNMYSAYGDGTPDDIYWKLGIYKWDWAYGNPSSTTTRTVYYDNVMYGNADSSIAELFPDGGGGPTPLTISSVTASADDGAGQVAGNTIDNNTGTYWAADCTSTTQWIKYDLGSSKTVGSAQITWYNGSSRVYGYTIQTSTDNTNWTTRYSGHSSGSSSSYETANFADVSARYVRITGTGNSVNNWTSIAEVDLFGSDGGGNAGTYGEQTSTATASADDGAGSVVGNTLDNNLGTRWAADCTSTTQWAKYDLGSAKGIDKLNIAYHYSDARRYNITIQYSKDGTTWTNLWTGQSILMPTTSYETYDFADKTARYIRIVGDGNTVNRWTSITEVEIMGY